MVTIFGIKHCDTVKKALKWLERENVTHQFHDFRKDGLDEDLVDHFLTGLGYSSLINTRGTTWRKLFNEQKADLNAAKARNLMLTNDAIIKRPVWLFEDGAMRIGFSKKEQDSIAEKLQVKSLTGVSVAEFIEQK